ncbi:sulfite exporter TauE/SafE family protein [Fredinandcohnia onubensis]|uniref:sulfite exporter TauE/SafE family protein n=1 Tax=Fredinandcohnia onubensis TaxID=1571209 RepID=UPI000C0C1023|nr:sulfite exporter TauE/SafE family protein [Fredinandcohnia onubensis]
MDILIGVLILFAMISGLAKVGFGFGAGIVLNPILTLFVPSATAVTLLAPILWFSNFTGARTHRKSIEWNLIKKMLPMAIIGTLLGSLVLAYVNDQILKPTIGIIAIIMGFFLLISRKKIMSEKEVEEKQDSTSVITKKIGFKYHLGALLSGLVGSTANSGGLPLIVLFLNDRSINKNAFAANIVIMLAIMDSIKIILYLILGILNIQNFLLVALYIPFIYVGALVGKWVHSKISEKSFFTVVHSMIFIIGIMLLF